MHTLWSCSIDGKMNKHVGDDLSEGQTELFGYSVCKLANLTGYLSAHLPAIKVVSSTLYTMD